MREKTVVYEANGVKATITVNPASFLDDMVRGELVQKALAEPANGDEWSQAKRTAQVVIWPSLACATKAVNIEVDGIALTWPPISFDAFLRMRLPGDLISQWMEAIFEMNPGWRPEGIDSEKKE